MVRNGSDHGQDHAGLDIPILQAVARARRLDWFQVLYARIVLAVAGGEPVGWVASRMECDPATVWRLCRRYEQGGWRHLLLDAPRLGRPLEISPLQRARIVELACLAPIAEGLHIPHWASLDLARQAVADGIVDAINPRTVRRIMHDVDLQPHRTRRRRTTRQDARPSAPKRKLETLSSHGENYLIDQVG
ncbi:MAG TPA: helix-turn-helix domain-containing protein [Gemmataceae bacterium]|nr:helix-turn-helix domain-containing protein [Gemmataceae bacterium]